MVSQPKKRGRPRKTVPETGKRYILSPKQLAQQHTDAIQIWHRTEMNRASGLSINLMFQVYIMICLFKKLLRII